MASDVRVPKLLRVRDVEEITGLARWRLYELIAQGKGPRHLRIGKTISVPEDALIEWIDEQSTTNHREEA